MANVEYSVTIARPVSDVFSAATGFDKLDAMRKWQPDLLSVGITAGDPLRTGTMIAMTRRFLGSQIFVNVDVVDFQRNKRIELKGMHGRFAYRREIEFSPSGRDTVLTDRITIAAGWLFFWYRPFLYGAVRRQITQEWNLLKNQLSS